MIARLSGMLIEKRADAAVVDVGGVGYLVHLSQQSLSRLGPPGAAVELRTHTHVREDALQLYGFASGEEEELFHLLIGVSGVGPRLGINILSGMPAGELAVALEGGEIARLTRIPGVGKKTAERAEPGGATARCSARSSTSATSRRRPSAPRSRSVERWARGRAWRSSFAKRSR
jgi:Holliday junction DNA helicase RuvA